MSDLGVFGVVVTAIAGITGFMLLGLRRAGRKAGRGDSEDGDGRG